MRSRAECLDSVRVPRKSLTHHQKDGASLARSGRRLFLPYPTSPNPVLRHEILREHGTCSSAGLAMSSVPTRPSLLPILSLNPDESMSLPDSGGPCPLPMRAVVPRCLCLITLLYPLPTLSASVQTLVSHSDISRAPSAGVYTPDSPYISFYASVIIIVTLVCLFGGYMPRHLAVPSILDLGGYSVLSAKAAIYPGHTFSSTNPSGP